MRIQHNMAATNAYSKLSKNQGTVAKNLERLSSGFRINRAGDDAAGLAISEKMRAQIKGLDTAEKNANDGISLVQTAEGSLTEVHSMLNRMTELATQSANGTYDNNVDRANLQKEVEALKSEINRISDSSNYNGIKLLDGSLSAKVSNAATASTAKMNLGDGVTINTPVDGAGVKNVQSFALNFGTGDSAALLGADDTVTITYNDSVGGTGPDKTFTMKPVTGATKEAQLADIASQINNDAMDNAGTPVANDIKTKYDASVKDGRLVLTAKAEGTASIQFKSVAVDDKQVSVAVGAGTAAAAVAPAANSDVRTSGGINDLVCDAAGAAKDISAGDKLKFTFNVGGAPRTIELTATNKAPAETLAAGEFRIGADLATTTTNIANALKGASFTDDAATAIDESVFKVQDYFTVTDNDDATAVVGTTKVGSLHIVNNAASLAKTGAKSADFELTAVDFSKATVDAQGAVTNAAYASAGGTISAGAGGTNAATAAGTAEAKSYKFSNTFAEGESVSFQGTLADGKSFKVTLKATTKTGADVGANEFTIGATAQATSENIIAALKDADTVVNTTDGTGNKATVTGDKVFAANTSKEIQVVLNADNASIDFTSSMTAALGKGTASGVTSADVTTKTAITSSAVSADEAGKLQSKATNVITFDNQKVEEGTTFQIDGKTYEFTTKTGNTSKTGNIEVVVANLGKRGADGALTSDAATANDIAKALLTKMDDDHSVTAGASATTGAYTAADGKAYDLSVDAGTGTLNITSVATGTTAHPLTGASASGGIHDVSVVKFNTTTVGVEENAKEVLNVKVGDTLSVNGKTYEFLASGSRTTNKDSIGVTLDGTEVKPADVAKKLADAINANDTKSIATVNEKNGSVEIAGKFNSYAAEGSEYNAPKVELPNSTEGLVLQVGDTSDDFQSVKVQVGNMNSTALGIKDIDIGTQDGAKAAIDKIKSAINSVSSTRGDLGAIQNRLEHTINNLGVTNENMTAAESRIRDVDMAKEMMDFTKNNIMSQAAQAMLAQANQLPQGVLQLLQ